MSRGEEREGAGPTMRKHPRGFHPEEEMEPGTLIGGATVQVLPHRFIPPDETATLSSS